MKTLGMRLLFGVAVCLVVLLAPARAVADNGVTVGVGHTYTHSFGRTPFAKKPRVTVNDPNIASVSWQGEESGTLVITGVKEGEAIVTITGQLRVTPMGAGEGAVETIRNVSASVPVKVIGAGEYGKIVVLHVRQIMSIRMPDRMRLGPKAPTNSNPKVVFVRRNSSKQLTLRGRKVGKSTLRFKVIVREEGKEKEIPGTIWVEVVGGKPALKRLKIDWDALRSGVIGDLGGARAKPKPKPKPKAKAKKKKDRRVGLADWPGQEGVCCTFVPSGRNYGDIGDLIIENDCNQPVTVTVPPGLLLESSDPRVQDLCGADVYTQTPCDGAKEIGKAIEIEAGGCHVIEHFPGVCPDHEKDPPAAGDEEVFTCRQPNERSRMLLDMIGCARGMDVGELKVFEKGKAKEMVTQGGVWMVDSEMDETKGNELSSDMLAVKFYDAFAASAKESLDKMSAEDRKEAERLVRDDLRKIAKVTDVLAKGVQERARTRERERKEGKLPPGVIEIGDNPETKADATKTCTRKKNPGRRMQDSEATGFGSEARSFSDAEKARLTDILSTMPNFLYNMDMVFLRVDKWAFDPNNPGGYQPGGLIVLTDNFFARSEADQKKALKHELGHQWHEQNRALVQDFLKIGWQVKEGKSYEYEYLGGTVGITSEDRAPSRKADSSFPRRPEDTTDPPYSGTSPIEDFGVSLEIYLDNPDSLKRQSPERYDWMEKNIPKDAPAAKPGAM